MTNSRSNAYLVHCESMVTLFYFSCREALSNTHVSITTLVVDIDLQYFQFQFQTKIQFIDDNSDSQFFLYRNLHHLWSTDLEWQQKQMERKSRHCNEQRSQVDLRYEVRIPGSCVPHFWSPWILELARTFPSVSTHRHSFATSHLDCDICTQLSRRPKQWWRVATGS